MSKVRVIADKNGNVINVSQNNPEYGSIRVEQEVAIINNTGWVKNVRRVAFINGKVEDLASLNYTADQEIKGKIVVKESLKPFNLESPDKNLKVAGDTGVICRYEDQPIYSKTFFTTNLNTSDELLSHTNSEEIKEVQVAQKAIKSLKDIQNEIKSKKKEVNL